MGVTIIHGKHKVKFGKLLKKRLIMELKYLLRMYPTNAPALIIEKHQIMSCNIFADIWYLLDPYKGQTQSK